MNFDFVTRNWALVAGSVLGTAILLFVLYRAWIDSARGKLQRRVHELRRKQAAAEVAARRLDKLQRQLAGLKARADSVKPSLIAAADEAVQDAGMLKTVADDQVLIAMRRVREVILEEFPPKRHDDLRARYL